MSGCCRRTAASASEGMAVPAGTGIDADRLLCRQRVPEILPAPGELCQRPGVPPHHLRLPPRSHSRTHHVRHGLVQHRCVFKQDPSPLWSTAAFPSHTLLHLAWPLKNTIARTHKKQHTIMNLMDCWNPQQRACANEMALLRVWLSEYTRAFL